MIGESGGSSSELEELLRHLVAGPVDAIVVTAATTSDGPLLRRIAEVVPLVVALRPVSGAGLLWSPRTIMPAERWSPSTSQDCATSWWHSCRARLRWGTSSGGGRGSVRHAERCNVVEVPGLPLAAEPTAAEGARLTEGVLRGKHAPTAIFAHNDAMAMRAPSGSSGDAA